MSSSKFGSVFGGLVELKFKRFSVVRFDATLNWANKIYPTRKYPLRRYILGSGAPVTPGIMG